MQHFIISAEEVHRQLTHLNTNKNGGADEVHPKILASLAFYLATPLAKRFNSSLATFKILQYLKAASLLSDAQHGFEPRRLCHINLIIVNHKHD